MLRGPTLHPGSLSPLGKLGQPAGGSLWAPVGPACWESWTGQGRSWGSRLQGRKDAHAKLASEERGHPCPALNRKSDLPGLWACSHTSLPVRRGAPLSSRAHIAASETCPGLGVQLGQLFRCHWQGSFPGQVPTANAPSLLATITTATKPRVPTASCLVEMGTEGWGGCRGPVRAERPAASVTEGAPVCRGDSGPESHPPPTLTPGAAKSADLQQIHARGEGRGRGKTRKARVLANPRYLF